MRNSKLFLLLVLFLTASAVSAQKTWEKPYQKWNKEDVIKILNTSPWVQSYQSSDAIAANDRAANAQSQAGLRVSGQAQVTGSTQRNLSVAPITVRLHSAIIVRQAIVRMQQIDLGYDKMDEIKRAEFDASMKSVLDCNLCKKFYIVTMAKAINSSGQNVGDGLFQTMKNEDLKGNIWLVNEAGEKMELAQFIPPKGAKDLAIFFFPRLDEKGNIFISPESKSFKVVFNNAFLLNTNPYAALVPRNFEFNVSKLIMGGNFVF